MKKYESFGVEHTKRYKASDGHYLTARDILDYTNDPKLALLSEGIDIPGGSPSLFVRVTVSLRQSIFLSVKIIIIIMKPLLFISDDGGGIRGSV